MANPTKTALEEYVDSIQAPEPLERYVASHGNSLGYGPGEGPFYNPDMALYGIIHPSPDYQVYPPNLGLPSPFPPLPDYDRWEPTEPIKDWTYWGPGIEPEW